MAKLTYNERFTDVHKYNEDGSYTGLQIASKLNQKNGQDYKLIDSIDIDWNGVWSSAANAYIYDTYQLFETIDNIADLTELEWVKNKLNELTDDVDLIMSTYVTQDQLNELLSHYEHALEAGEHITIDENNIISTYDLLTPEEANEKFTTIEEFTGFANFIRQNYYDIDTANIVIDRISTENIQELVIKNADEQYNDLEKISYWILQQPDDITGGLEEINNRVNRLDEVVGYSIYNEEFDNYTYSGMILDVYELQNTSKFLINQVNSAVELAEFAAHTSTIAYDTSIEAYDFAYYAYEIAITSDAYSYLAYQMAYYAVETIGVPHSYGYFLELTREDIRLLQEDPTAIEVYAIRYGNDSGIPLLEEYDPLYDGQYYKYIPEIEATGFHKDIDNISAVAYYAQYSADTALYRLYSQTTGTTYASLDLDPESYTDDIYRKITLNVDEAEIDSYSGEIGKEGFITTYSLSNTLSYISTFVIINNENDNTNNG